MVRLHKLAAIGLAVTLSSVGSAFALGLGEVTWKSSLNQPLNAEIAVYDAHNISNKELVVTLATDEEFAKAGIDKPYTLSDLVFTPVIGSNGRGVIKVTSNLPIKEPYLDFLLSVSWSSGQTLREYTLLIDPPAYTPARVASSVKTQVQPEQPKAKPKTQPKAVSTNTKPAPKRASASSSIKEGGTVKAFRGSSLWLLAERSRGNTSVHQAMLAIYEANPDAFVDGKMSKLKEGAVLRIPTREQMRKTARTEALSEVLANVSGKVTERQMIASRKEQEPKVTEPAQDQLKLTGVSSDGTSDSASSNTGKSTIAQLTNQVTQSAEELDATRSKNNELRSRLSDLESRLADMKKLIELKDNQLAALQSNIAKATKAVADDKKPDDKVIETDEAATQDNSEQPAKVEDTKTL